MEAIRLRRANAILVGMFAFGLGCSAAEVTDKDAATTDGGVVARDAGAADAGGPDVGGTDAGLADAGLADAGLADDAGFADAAEAHDAGFSDAGFVEDIGFAEDVGFAEDAGFADAGFSDAGFVEDAGFADAGFVEDAGFADAGFAEDVGFPEDAGLADDASSADAAALDATIPDAEPDATAPDTGPSDAGPPDPTCVAAPSAQVPPQAGLLERANASVGFSGVQGQCGWRYGYQVPTATTGFQLMLEWNPGGAWLVDSATLWTQIQREIAHPNGITTSGGRRAIDQWAIRRWESDVAGLVRITGAASKSSSGGNGVDVRILVDGVQAYAQYVAGTDAVGVSFTLSATVAVGSAIDFVLEPHDSNDLVDATRTELHVWQ